MAKIKGTQLRKLHTQMGDLLTEFETNIAAERAAAGEDNELGIGPETPVEGAQDSAARGGVPMGRAFKNFNRIPHKG